MIKVLRKHRNWLMIVIAVLALPFCLYFVKSDTSLIRSDNFVEMYGRKVTMTEAHRYARLFQLSQLLGMSDLLEDLAPGSGTDDQKVGTFIINLILLRHEAERLGIEPADSEIVETVKNFPALQGPSAYPRHVRGRQAAVVRGPCHHRGRLSVGAETVVPGRRADRLRRGFRQRAAHQGQPQRDPVGDAGGRARRRGAIGGPRQ